MAISVGARREDAVSPLAAMGAELALVAVLLLAAGLAWWSTAQQMTGMNAGPSGALGSVVWFSGVWATMMAAMMLPSFAPAAAAFATSVRRQPGRIVLFAVGYLLVWGVAGIGAYGLCELGRNLLAGSLAWHRGGRMLAAGVLALAALYELTPLKRALLARCRSPLAALGSSRPNTSPAALVMGIRNGGWCLGCSWALMAALFALGVMSLRWMGLIALLVALERVGPWSRLARSTAAVILAALAVGIFAAPHDVPGFVVPSALSAPHAMKAMG